LHPDSAVFLQGSGVKSLLGQSFLAVRVLGTRIFAAANKPL
jgi:hypothetical protein